MNASATADGVCVLGRRGRELEPAGGLADDGVDHGAEHRRG